MNFRFISAAFEELQSSIEFYSHESGELGDRFAAEVEASLESIGLNPKASAIVDQHQRRRVLKSFPYAIIYRVDESEIVVSAIAHSSRDPKSWAGRLGQ